MGVIILVLKKRRIEKYMKFYEYGDQSKPVIMMIHGGGNSKRMYERQAGLMRKDYRIILPELDGHGEEYNRIYESTIVEADKIVEYIKKECKGNIYIICGASLGAQITMEVCARADVKIDHAILESGLYIARPFYAYMISANWMIKSMMAMYKWKRMVRWSFKQYGWPEELMEPIIKDAMALSFPSNRNLYGTYLNYKIPKRLSKINTKVILLFGSKEKRMIKNDAYIASKVFKYVRIEELEGYHHCGFSFLNPEVYVQKVQDWIQN